MKLLGPFDGGSKLISYSLFVIFSKITTYSFLRLLMENVTLMNLASLISYCSVLLLFLQWRKNTI